ncbi:hypothetical protein J6590_020785 [Homalodisca vitripennis]|nr:hypothetical protein J6590_020785 [Homalodisca vitripennis]
MSTCRLSVQGLWEDGVALRSRGCKEARGMGLTAEERDLDNCPIFVFPSSIGEEVICSGWARREGGMPAI